MLIKRRRSHFLLKLIFAVFFWLVWFLIVFFTPPTNKFMTLFFFFALFLSLSLTLGMMLANHRRGFLIASGLILALVLQWQQLIHWLNLMLLAAVIFCFEAYFTKKK